MQRLALTVGLMTLLAVPALADGSGWPRESIHPEATVVMYQPQIERVTENEIEGRAAVSVTMKGSDEPVFGAVWLTARLEIDRETRMVAFRDIRVPEVRFADASDEHKEGLARYLEEQMPTWELDMELDRLIPLLEVAEHDSLYEAGLKHDAPKIVVSSEPAILVVIDGSPRMQRVTAPEKAHKKEIQQAVNTPVLIAYDPKSDAYYLAGGGDLWYEAADALGPYSPTTKVPKVVLSLVPESDEEYEEAEGQPPRIVVATEPTELIVVAGEPQYAPLGDVDLLTVSNADRDVLLEMGSNDHYVLLSGRWYVSKNKMEGPWSFVPPEELPESFAEIPTDSDRAHLRAHVPGTVEAREAVLDNTIPQTAAIRRDDSSFNARYDGTPKFEDVEGAGAQYAVNSPQSVFKVGSRYYACEQAVWYESGSATGPWRVATSVPDVIYDIPPSNPHHNVTYVKVYDVQPQVVYVGYTPGYVGSYVYGGCVVYGTGWYYPGWYGSYYYPRPHTWGFHATYNPYTGWGFGISWSSGPLTITFGGGGYPGWWGPMGYRPYYPAYRPPYYPGYRPPYYPGYHPPAGGTRPPAAGTRPTPTGGTRPQPGSPAPLPSTADRAARPSNNNLYARDNNATRNAAQPATGDRSRPTTAEGRPNNVYTDRNGDVYRRNSDGGWDQRQGNNWTPSSGAGGGSSAGRPSTQPAQPGGGPSAGRPSTQPSQPSGGSSAGRPSTTPSQPGGGSSLNRDYGARSRSQSRSRQYNSTPRPSAPRGGGGRRR